MLNYLRIRRSIIYILFTIYLCHENSHLLLWRETDLAEVYPSAYSAASDLHRGVLRGRCRSLCQASGRGEIINDLNMELTNFYWMAKICYPELKQQIEKTLHCRDLHAHAAHVNAYPQFFTPVERAWAVWALSKMSFASMLDGTFGYDFNGAMPKKVRNAKDEFTERICIRLQHVTIENRNALDVIACYDSPDTFHFVDPPYVNSDCGHYEGVFSEQNLEQLLDLLETVKGRFMLTMFPFELIDRRAQRNGWIIHRIERTISASKTSRRRQEEWIVCNYESDENLTLFSVC